MKTIRFTAYPDGYKCDQPGDQTGPYVTAAKAATLLGYLRNIFDLTTHQTFTCSTGIEFNDRCVKCIAERAIDEMETK